MTSEPKAAVDVEATSGKEIVLRDEQRGVRDFLGKAQALERNGAVTFSSVSGVMPDSDVGPVKPGAMPRADAIVRAPWPTRPPSLRHRPRGGVVRLPVVADARDAGG